MSTQQDSNRIGKVISLDKKHNTVHASGFIIKDVAKAVAVGPTRSPGKITAIKSISNKEYIAFIKMYKITGLENIKIGDMVYLAPEFEDMYYKPAITTVTTVQPSCNIKYQQKIMVTKPVQDTRHIIDKTPDKFEEFPNRVIFTDVIKLTENKLLTYCSAFLRTRGYSLDDIIATKDYIYAKGTIPILLIAHLDTVHKFPVTTIYQHKDDKYLIAKEGIGGDDRCGVYMILRIIADGYKPHVLFTTDEECGGIGATVAAAEIETPDVKYMIEFDRRGKNDCVFYDNDNKEFIKYIEKFGFDKARGSFSDISILGPSWNIASVNLSCGYYNAHTVEEKIVPQEMHATVKKAMKMLDTPPDKNFEHVEAVYTYTYLTGKSKAIDYNWYGTKEKRTIRNADIPSKKVIDECVDCVNMLFDKNIITKFFFSNPSINPSLYGYDAPHVKLSERINFSEITTRLNVLYNATGIRSKIASMFPNEQKDIFACVQTLETAYIKHKFFRLELEQALYAKEKEKKDVKVDLTQKDKQPKQKQVEKAYECIKDIESLPFVSMVLPKSTAPDEINKKTIFPFFAYTTGTEIKYGLAPGKTYYVDELAKRSSTAHRILLENEGVKKVKAIQSCVDFLKTMYTTYYYFDKILLDHAEQKETVASGIFTDDEVEAYTDIITEEEVFIIFKKIFPKYVFELDMQGNLYYFKQDAEVVFPFDNLLQEIGEIKNPTDKDIAEDAFYTIMDVYDLWSSSAVKKRESGDR